MNDPGVECLIPRLQSGAMMPTFVERDRRTPGVLRCAWSLGAVAVIGATSVQARAQDGVGGARSVSGVVRDSLRGGPLSGALVQLPAIGRAVISSASGGFRIDSVPPGAHDVIVSHEILDSLGLPELRSRVVIRESDGVVELGVPSISTLWRSFCGRAAPADSGFVHGVVRSARTGMPMAGARVRIRWTDLAFDRVTGISQGEVGGEEVTGGTGRFVICGVPNAIAIRMRAVAGTGSTDEVEVLHPELGITRRDFLVPASGPGVSTGVVRGVVRTPTGDAVSGALVGPEGGSAVRSDERGGFLLADVPVGTRNLLVRSIGAQPITVIVEVPWMDTLFVEVSLARVAVLDSVRVVARGVLQRFVAELQERQALGVAKFLDSTRVLRYGNLRSALTAGSTARIDRDGSPMFGPENCRPAVWLDKVFVRPDDVALELRLLDVNQVGALEVYERRTGIPAAFWPPGGGMPNCAIVIWTKRSFP